MINKRYSLKEIPSVDEKLGLFEVAVYLCCQYKCCFFTAFERYVILLVGIDGDYGASEINR